MNTKFFILLSAFLLISLNSSSVNTNKKLIKISTVIDHTVEVVVPFNNKENDSKNTVPVDIQRHQKTNTSRNHSEEDGKHHHIHFHRLPAGGKRRSLLLLVAKLILVISHLSLLLYVFLHAIH
jgi:hypothetical protein